MGAGNGSGLTNSRRFTDADTTGAALVPIVTDTASTEGRSQGDVEYLEAVLRSHRR